MDKRRLTPTDIVVYKEIGKDEIDFKEIIKVIYSYKRFISLFFVVSLLLALLYLFITKPIYRVDAQIELGSYIKYNNNIQKRVFFTKPDKIIDIVKYKFDRKIDNRSIYPKIEIVQSSGLLSISVEDYSNQGALNYLKEIINFIKSKELVSILAYKKFLKKELYILDDTEKEYKGNLKKLYKRLNSPLNSKIEESIIFQISEYNKLISSIKLDKNRYQYILSVITEVNFTNEIKKSTKPIKPKYNLILLIASIASILSAIFIVFLIEFIKEGSDKLVLKGN